MKIIILNIYNQVNWYKKIAKNLKIAKLKNLLIFKINIKQISEINIFNNYINIKINKIIKSKIFTILVL